MTRPSTFLVDVAQDPSGKVDVCLVTLHNPLADVRKLNATVLDPAVRAGNPKVDFQLKVSDRPATPDEKIVQRYDLFRRCLANNFTVLNAPERGIAIPTIQCLTIKKRYEPRVVIRFGLRINAAAAPGGLTGLPSRSRTCRGRPLTSGRRLRLCADRVVRSRAQTPY